MFLTSSDGFKRGCERCGLIEPAKTHQKEPPLHKILPYFIIVAPEHRWHFKKKIKNFKSVVAACSASARYVSVACVLHDTSFFVKTFLFREYHGFGTKIGKSETDSK